MDQNIKTLQQYLRTLHLVDPSIPLVNIDGIYDANTEAAVLEFQRQNGLPETGETDFTTWEALRTAAMTAQKLLEAPRSLLVFDKGELPLKPGMYAGEIYLLQALLNALAIRYENLERVDITGRYDAKTMQQIGNLQRIFGMKENGILDQPLWEKITRIWK